MKKKKKDDIIFLIPSIAAAFVIVVLAVVFCLNVNNKGVTADYPDDTDTSSVTLLTDATVQTSAAPVSTAELTGSSPAIIALTEDTAPTCEQTEEPDTKAALAETVLSETSVTDPTPASSETSQQPPATEPTSSQAEATEATETTETTETAETEEARGNVQTYPKYERDYFSEDYFIGDSIYTGLFLYDFFPQKRVFAKTGLNPESARSAVINGNTAAGAIASLKPKRVFIMLGTNGLAFMGAQYMSGQLSKLVAELREASPDSKFYIVSIPPVTKVHSDKGQETIDMVRDYNSSLKSMAEENSAAFLDLFSELIDDNGYFSADYAEADGLHFLGSAYVRMLSFFQYITSLE